MIKGYVKLGAVLMLLALGALYTATGFAAQAGPTAQNGNVIQDIVPKPDKARCKTTAVYKGSFVNHSTSGNAVSWQAFTGTAPNSTAATVKRQFVTGAGVTTAYKSLSSETTKLHTTGTYAVTKLRFTNVSGATTICSDQN
jgi:hypothetical protein